MTTRTVTALAREFGLSRSTLLYYDEIGLLTPSARTAAGYRLYSDAEAERLRRICLYRKTGMPLDRIARLLRRNGGDTAAPVLLRRRLEEVNREIIRLRVQQQLITALLAGDEEERRDAPSLCNRQVLTAALRQAGLSEADLTRFHREFESAAPAAHHDFLSLLGFAPEEIATLRRHFRDLPE